MVSRLEGTVASTIMDFTMDHVSLETSEIPYILILCFFLYNLKILHWYAMSS